MISVFTHAPLPVQIPSGTEPSRRLRMFLGHYDLRVYVSDTAYVDVGRGSLEGAYRVDYVMPDFTGCIGTIGQFCEFAQPCKLFGGGEHHNNKPVNMTLSGVPVLAMTAARLGIADLRARNHSPFTIGNAALFSADAKVMAGTTVADGVVVAANALLKGETRPFQLYGGIPAARLAQRVDDETIARLQAVHWWDWDLVYLGNNMDRLQTLSIDTQAQHVYRRLAPRFVIKIAPQVQILGFLDGEVTHPISAMPPKVRDYVTQIGTEGPHHWVADIWNAA